MTRVCIVSVFVISLLFSNIVVMSSEAPQEYAPGLNGMDLIIDGWFHVSLNLVLEVEWFLAIDLCM